MRKKRQVAKHEVCGNKLAANVEPNSWRPNLFTNQHYYCIIYGANAKNSAINMHYKWKYRTSFAKNLKTKSFILGCELALQSTKILAYKMNFKIIWLIIITQYDSCISKIQSKLIVYIYTLNFQTYFKRKSYFNFADSVNADPVKGQNGSRGQHRNSYTLLIFLMVMTFFYFL